MKAAKSAWIEQFGTMPPGNGAEQASFGGDEEDVLDDDAIVQENAGPTYNTAAGAIASPFTEAAVHR